MSRFYACRGAASTTSRSQVLEAANGLDALELVTSRGGEINLVLSDMVMPGMEGIELAGRVRARRSFRCC